mmetsp:Transcript_30786/g.55781  ORF Transcript_30786/g.55781 Transcript_30786/m.55781 type:complete len:118 (-) Transcript_30786:1677-2030(-)
MSDDDYSEEDYEYEYTDDEDGPGVEGDSMDASQEELVNDHITDAHAKPAKDNTANKRRSIGSMDESRRSGDSPNAPPLSGGKFDFEGWCSLLPFFIILVKFFLTLCYVWPLLSIQSP